MVSTRYSDRLDYEPRLKVYERRDRPIKYWWSYWLPNGVRMRRSVSNTKQTATRNGKVKERQLLRGIFDEKDKERLEPCKGLRLTVAEAVDLYLSVTAKYKTGHTQRNEGYSIRAIFGYFSDKRKRQYIDEVTQEDVELYLDRLLEEGKSVNTANDYLRYIKKVFNKLGEFKNIDESPARNVKPIPVAKSQKARKVYIPKHHLDRIIQTPMTPHLTVALRAIIILMANTGMRVGEVLHLEWPDIDFEKRVIRLRGKPNCPTQFGMGWKPKWGEERNVPLNETALWVLDSQPRRRTVGFVRGREDPVPGEFVFPRAKTIGSGTDGRSQVIWARCDNIRHQWETLLKRAGLDQDGVLMEDFGIPRGSYTLHDLRRSFDTYSIEIARFTQNQASAVMGNDPLVNLEHYTGVIETEIRRKIEHLPFDYRGIPLTGDVQPTKGVRKRSLRLVKI